MNLLKLLKKQAKNRYKKNLTYTQDTDKLIKTMNKHLAKFNFELNIYNYFVEKLTEKEKYYLKKLDIK